MSAAEPQRYVLLIGAMKSGTTSLFQLLAQHPQILRSVRKEPKYFGLPRRPGDDDGDPRYLALFEGFDPARHKWVIEASTDYTKQPLVKRAPEAAERFAQVHGAEVRLIYIMRHPIERMESHFRWASKKYPRRVVFQRKQMIETAVSASCYASRLEPWIKRFGRERLLLVSFEEFERSGDAVLRRICEFLGVDPGHRFEAVEEPRLVSTRRRPTLNVLFRGKLGKAIARRLPPVLVERVRALVDRFGLREEPFLKDSERRRAAARLRPEIERLEKLGFDTSDWVL